MCSLANAADISDKLKVAYTINVIKYVSWSNAGNKITLCIDRNAALKPVFDNVDNYPLNDKQILKIQPQISAQCDVIFWDDKTLQDRPTGVNRQQLEIAQDISAIDSGVDLAMFVEDNRLKFRIKQTSDQRLDYKISSKLLRLSIVSISP